MLAAPDDFYLNELLAKALHLRGNLDGAVNAMRQAARLLPQNPVAHYNLGLLLNTQGRLAEAAASFRQAVERRPDYAEAHAGLAKVLARQGNSGGAFSALLRSLELKPDDADALLSLGQLWQQRANSRQHWIATGGRRSWSQIPPSSTSTGESAGRQGRPA